MKTPPYKMLLTVAVLWLAGLSHASTIFWSSSFTNNILLTSTGQPLDGSFSFEIGYFANGFDPTLEQAGLWQANWKVFDRAYDPTPLDPNDGDPEGWNEPLQFFVGTVEHTLTGGSSSPDANPTDVFNQGDVAYLWVYNTKNFDSTTEWALVKDTSGLANVWSFPDPTDTGSYNWDLDDADTAIVGGVNNMQGGGGYSVNPGTFALQTHMVPEPGSALLILLAAGVWASRRIRFHPSGSR
jgi:hypothetical protein